MSWVETTSLSFTARHESAQTDDAIAVLEDLEEHRTHLEQLFPRLPGNVTIVLHDSPLQLWLAHPMLLVSRMLARRSARRYVAAWYRADEVHSLSRPMLRALSAGADSERAMLLSPRRAFTALVVGINNPLLPPPSRPAAVRRTLLRNAWLTQGASQYFSGQVPLLRAAMAMRLRQGRLPFLPVRGTHPCWRAACSTCSPKSATSVPACDSRPIRTAVRVTRWRTPSTGRSPTRRTPGAPIWSGCRLPNRASRGSVASSRRCR